MAEPTRPRCPATNTRDAVLNSGMRSLYRRGRTEQAKDRRWSLSRFVQFLRITDRGTPYAQGRDDFHRFAFRWHGDSPRPRAAEVGCQSERWLVREQAL